MFTVLYREEKREEGDRHGQEDKSPPNQTKEEEIGNLPDKEF